MMDVWAGVGIAVCVYVLILVNKWHLLRQFDRVLKRVDDAEVAIEAHPCKQPWHNAVLLDVAADCKRKIAALPAFGVCEICGGHGFADGMTKMTGKEYDDLRGVVGLNRCLIHNHVVHLHDECLRRAGYVHEYGVVAGWRKCPTVESKVFEKDSPKKGKG